MPDRHNPYTSNYEGKFDHKKGIEAVKDALYEGFIIVTAYEKIIDNQRSQNFETIVEQAKAARQARNKLDAIYNDVKAALEDFDPLNKLNMYQRVISDLRTNYIDMYHSLYKSATNVVIQKAGL